MWYTTTGIKKHPNATVWRNRVVGRARTIGNRVTGNTVREFESLFLRQSKPKSNTRVFGLGFSFAKNKVLSAFSAVGVLSFYPFRGSYGCVRIPLSVAFADGFTKMRCRCNIYDYIIRRLKSVNGLK